LLTPFFEQTNGKTLEEIDYVFFKHRDHSNEMHDNTGASNDTAQKIIEGETAQVERA